MKLRTLVKTLILLGSLLFNFSCKPSTSENTEFTNLKVEYLETARLSDLIERDYKYVSLASDTSHIIGSTNRVVIKDNLIYILDSSIAKRIFCFDSLGKFKFSFGKVGDGPGEYNHPSDMVVVEDKILVHDGTNFTLLTYDIAGHFQDEEMIGFWIKEFIPFNDKQLLVYTPSDYSENGIDSEPKVLKIMSVNLSDTYAEFFPYQENHDDASFPGYLTSFNNTYSFAKPLYGYVYTIKANLKTKLRYKIDFGKYSWPIDMDKIEKDQKLSEELMRKGNIMTVVHRLLETKEYFMFQTLMIDPLNERKKLDYNEDRWLCIYNKKSNKCYAIHKVINDIDGGSFSFPQTTDGNKLVSIIQPEQLLMENNVKTPMITNEKKANELKRLVDTLDIFSNPVIMTYRLKPNIEL